MPAKLKGDYPLCRKHGIKINTDGSVAGCDQHTLKAAMQRLGLWKKFCHQSSGWTCTQNGMYPWDVEGFLEGRPNLD